MQGRMLLVVLAMVSESPAVSDQHGGAAGEIGAQASRMPPPEAARFNFLVGQWELEVKPAPSGLGQRVHGVPRLTGVWKAWRALDGWGIEDDLRITDASGNPVGFTHSVRYYNASARSWQSSAIDVHRGVFTSGTAQWRDNQMMTISRGTDAENKAHVSRGRFSGIGRSSFRFVQERSFDNGKSWKEHLTIEAKRVAATATR